MSELRELLSTVDATSARSIIYYAIRYLKQARHFRNYHKDIFEDVENSVPPGLVRAYTLDVIELLEKMEGLKATEFNESNIQRSLQFLTSFEQTLSPDFTEEEIAAAKNFAVEMETPKVS